MASRRGFAPLIAIIIIAAALIGGGIGSYAVISKQGRRAPDRTPPSAVSNQPQVISQETVRAVPTVQTPTIAQAPPPTSPAKTSPSATTSAPSSIPSAPSTKVFEFETREQGIVARFEAPRDWVWHVPPTAANNAFICRPQSRGYGCVLVAITRGAARLEQEANDRYQQEAQRRSSTTLRQASLAGRDGRLVTTSYEITTGLDRDGNPIPGEKVGKKMVTQRIFYFVAPGLDFFVTADDWGGVFFDVPEIRETYERIIRTFKLIDASQPLEIK